MTPGKRRLDACLALALVILLAPLIATIALAVLLLDGAPVLHASERMKTPERAFCLWKFRTMRPVQDDFGVSGGHKRGRVTRLGAWLRRYRLDELPQLVNILRGDMSFVGPRPPLRRYVEMFPDLYGRVLEQRPGLTGLATLVYRRTEERLLSRCRCADAAEEVYVRRCVPTKARLDLIWARQQCPWRDLRLLWQTLLDVMAPERAHEGRAMRSARPAGRLLLPQLPVSAIARPDSNVIR